MSSMMNRDMYILIRSEQAAVPEHDPWSSFSRYDHRWLHHQLMACLPQSIRTSSTPQIRYCPRLKKDQNLMACTLWESIEVLQKATSPSFSWSVSTTPLVACRQPKLLFRQQKCWTWDSCGKLRTWTQSTKRPVRFQRSTQPMYMEGCLHLRGSDSWSRSCLGMLFLLCWHFCAFLMLAAGMRFHHWYDITWVSAGNAFCRVTMCSLWSCTQLSITIAKDLKLRQVDIANSNIIALVATYEPLPAIRFIRSWNLLI